MAHISRTRVFLFSAAAVAVVSLSMPAQAGFEWRGPLVPPAPPPSHVPAPPAATSDMDGLAPVIEWDGAPPAESAAMPAAMPAVRPTPVDAAPMGATPPQYDADGGAVVDGFGADLPLVIAVQQIAPPGFRVSFSPGVNPGEQVSWQGGRPWKHVLADTLGSVGLSSKIEDGTLVIMRYPVAAPVKQAVVDMDDDMMPPPVMLSDSAPPPAAVEDGRVLVGRASETGTKMEMAPPADAPPQETVSIRRKKPKTFLEKLGLFDSKEEAEAIEEAPEVQVSSAPPSAEPLPEEIPAAPPPDSALAAPVSLTGAPVAANPVPMADESLAATPGWHGTKGETLRAVLSGWSQTAGVEMYWSVDYDYKLDADMDFSGTYDEAVDKILKSFSAARPQPYGKLHQASDGPRVLVIKVYDSAG